MLSQFYNCIYYKFEPAFFIIKANKMSGHSTPCTCSVSVDNQDCYVWIKLQNECNRVILFDSISSAYAYGEKYISENNLQSNITYSTTLCRILNHIEDDRKSDYWQIFECENYVVNIGLGSDLPEKVRHLCGPLGFTTVSQNQGDMPALVWIPEFEPQPPEPIILGHTHQAIPWQRLPDGERSPNLLLKDNTLDYLQPQYMNDTPYILQEDNTNIDYENVD